MILLASQSPRRRDLLTQIGVPFTVCPVEVDEGARPGEAPRDYVLRVAGAKALAARQVHPEAVVIGADTAVVIEGQILGKPTDAADAARMLRLLSDREHQVMSAVALAGPQGLATRLSVSAVRFRAISAAEAAAYWRTGEPHDKAGGYAIQGLGALFVSHLAGSYSGVMGLPLYETADLLRAAELPTGLPSDETKT